jgi:ubiquinone/menaquinone biosynthesis C-methylase UbiE
MIMEQKNSITIKDQVREKYGDVARLTTGEPVKEIISHCCGGHASMIENISKMMGYSEKDLAQAPHHANMGLGCGNPKAIASLKPGETVLDLGSGGGFDGFLAAREVGETGKVIGVDMTPEMISLARKNAAETNVKNIEFRLGDIENLPVADSSVDVIMSNCVINLSPEKQKVFQEAFRVLKPGGRLAISDIVAIKPLPESVQNDPAMRCGCIGGAALADDIRTMLEETGFLNISIEIAPESGNLISQWFSGIQAEDYIRSAMICAIKPI